MAQTARQYDFALFENNTARQRAAPRLQVVQGGARKQSKLEKIMVAVPKVIMLAVTFSLMISMLSTKASVVQATTMIQETNIELTQAKSEYSYLSSKLAQKTSYVAIEETVASLGMMPVDESQLTYIRIGEDGDRLCRTQKEPQITKVANMFLDILLEEN